MLTQFIASSYRIWMFFSVQRTSFASTSQLFPISCSSVLVCSKEESAVVRYLAKSLCREFISLTCLWREEEEEPVWTTWYTTRNTGISTAQQHRSRFGVIMFSWNWKIIEATRKCGEISSLCRVGVLSWFPQTTCQRNNSSYRCRSFLNWGQLGQWGGKVSKLWFVRQHEGFSWTKQHPSSRRPTCQALWGWRGASMRGYMRSEKAKLGAAKAHTPIKSDHAPFPWHHQWLPTAV